MFSKNLKRKDNIIIAAIDLLDEAGIRGMTTKEIARRQNITEPAIYRQFASKKEIILTILQKFSDFDQSINNTVTEQKMKCMDGIRFFMNAYAEYYQNYPQIATVILSYDMFHYDDETNKTMKKIINDRRKFVAGIIKKGQSLNEFSKDISSEDAADIITGIIWSTTYSWKMQDCNFSLKQKFSKILDQCIGSWACTNAKTVGSEK
ncbi:MAG TPA: TetR/AcrR family transcriptional regulator [Ruminiclostridium sp.]